MYVLYPETANKTYECMQGSVDVTSEEEHLFLSNIILCQDVQSLCYN